MEAVRKDVQVIRATNKEEESLVLRVAAYCRVSTDSDDQMNSFFAQMQYYNDYIRENDNMILVDIYADEGITGTSLKKRDEFKRMLKDAQNGKFDRVLVKSVQRFARNSVECIESVRALSLCGTSVYFENDRIDTESMNSEMMLYIKSAFAQGESLSHSRRMKLSIKMKMENGTFYNATAPYGYRFENRELVIVPEEAENVRLIFRLYCSGMGANAIVEYMNRIDTDGFDWNIGRINWMLRNERYMGDYVAGKTFTPTQLPLRNRMNKGQEDMFYWENANEPIITKTQFYEAQEIMAKRKKVFYQDTKNKLFFSNKIRCRKCGWIYRNQNKRSGRIWVCSKKGHAMTECHSPSFKDEQLQGAFVRAFNTLKQNQKVVLDETIQQLQQLRARIIGSNDAIAEIDSEIATLTTQGKSCANLYANGGMAEVIYLEKTDKIKKKITELRSRRLKLIGEDENEKCIEELRQIKRIINEVDGTIEDFSEELFDSMVESIFVEQDGDVCFKLKGEVELKIGRDVWQTV